MSGQNSGTGQRVKMNVTSVWCPRRSASVNARPRSSISANGAIVSPRLRRAGGGAPASTGMAAPRPVTATSSATLGPDPTRSRNRTRSPGASRTDSSASVNAIVIAGM